MKASRTAISDVLLVEPEVFEDDRGFFMEAFQDQQFSAAGICGPFVQDNHTGSRQGVLRGLHYQIRRPQGKLVYVAVGEVFDVAVDLRRSSTTFGKWVGVLLSANHRRQLWVPSGFAHGFYVLSEWAEVMYKVTDYHAPEWERTLIWNDPDIGIRWPLRDESTPLLSAKDAQGRRLAESELFD